MCCSCRFKSEVSSLNISLLVFDKFIWQNQVNRMGHVKCYDKVVSASRGERGLRAASTRLGVKLRVSGCSRGLGHARGLSNENTSWITQEVELGC